MGTEVTARWKNEGARQVKARVDESHVTATGVITCEDGDNVTLRASNGAEATVKRSWIVEGE